MKVLRNQEGFAIVLTIMILAILTLLGFSSVQTSMTEVQITTNMHIHHMTFYAAESGRSHGSLWLNSLDLKDDVDTDWFGPDEWFNLDGTKYTWQVKHQVDDDGKILYYGDLDGDFLWEINTISGMPLEFLESNGTHPRGGRATIHSTWIFNPSFTVPKAPLWVEDPDKVDFKGNASVIGDSQDTAVCEDVPDMVYHQAPTVPVDEPKHYGLDFVHESSGGTYPFSLVQESLSKRADYIGDVFPTAIAEASTQENPVIIVLTGDIIINNEDLKVPAYGILFIDGNLSINGNVEWNGLIVTTGDTSIGNGTANINGSLVTGDGADVDITGAIVIQYDCESLAKMFDTFSGYRMTSWRQM